MDGDTAAILLVGIFLLFVFSLVYFSTLQIPYCEIEVSGNIDLNMNHELFKSVQITSPGSKANIPCSMLT